MNKAAKIGTVALSAGAGIGIFGYWLSNQIDYEPISIQVDAIQSDSIHFNVVFSVKNPTSLNMSVSKQFYEIFVAGHLISSADAQSTFRIMKRGTSTLLVRLQIKFQDIKDKIPSFNGVDLVLLNQLQVAVLGKLSAKIGVLPLFPMPIRSHFTIGDLL